MVDESDYIRKSRAGEAAASESGQLASASRLERLHEDQVRYDLTWNNVTLLEPIGFGGFSQVFKVQVGDNVEKAYALKCLNPQTKLRTKTFCTGAVDLAIEGEILSRLDHENVIKLHGISELGPREAYMETDRGYFIVLDLLSDTLAGKLDQYRAHKKGGLSKSSSSKSTPKEMSESAVLERVSSVALGVAKGMEYLHSQGVALRDLKPDNVGFDEHGTPKIFDLGFAREEHTIKKTEVAGSLRYMAPEVALGRGSRLSSDVYSFGVLLWEICTLEKPYKSVSSRDAFMNKIIVNQWRHTTSAIPNKGIRKLIKECWQDDHNARPTFSQIVKKLRVELSLTATTKPVTKNWGFGSSVNLKRTATWSSNKKNSTLGMFRIGFKSGSSVSKNMNEKEDGQSTSESSQNATFEKSASKEQTKGKGSNLVGLQKETIMEMPEIPSPTPPTKVAIPPMPNPPIASLQ